MSPRLDFLPPSLLKTRAARSHHRHHHASLLPRLLFLAFLLLLSVVLTLSTSTAALTALPPGYEDDHLLCKPAAACLRRRSMPPGWCGPRAAFVECCNPGTAEVSRPRGWGPKMDPEYLRQLLEGGWRFAPKCTAGDAQRCDAKKHPRSATLLGVMERMVNRLLLSGTGALGGGRNALLQQ